jgi:competence protein ComEC
MNFDHFLSHQLSLSLEGQKIRVQGRVVGLPDNNSLRTSFIFKIDQTYVEGQLNDSGLANVRVRLSCYRCSYDIKAGQTWRLFVKLKRPNGYASYGAFDYEKFLFSQNIVATGYVLIKHENTLLAQGDDVVNQWRANIKQQLLDQLDPERVATGMMMALLIGDKSALSRDQKNVIQDTGISHLLAISGLHVGLVFD